MVKGNWERRAELAEARRLEAKEKKAARSTKASSTKSVILSLQKYMPIDTILSIWLCNDEDKIVCSHWLRQGLCENKKCRQPHEPFSTLLSTMNGINISITDCIGKDVACDEPKSTTLWDISSDDIEHIKFIAIPCEKRLVYDYLNLTIWNDYKLEIQRKYRMQNANSENTTNNNGSDTLSSSLEHTQKFTTSSSLKLSCINESDDIIDEVFDENRNLQQDNTNNSSTTTLIESFKNRVNLNDGEKDSSNECNECIAILSANNSTSFIIAIPPKTVPKDILQATLSSCFFYIAEFLSDADIIHFFLLSKSIKGCCYSDHKIRQRRKEIMNRMTLLRQNNKLLLSKREEKKKKQKQSHLRNNSKVDAFARGGGSGR